MGAHSVNVRDFDRSLYCYRARYVRTIDGDTVLLMLSTGMDMYYEMRVRLAGFSAPERNTPEGKIAMRRMQDIFASDRYTGAMLETRFWPLRVVTEKAPGGNEVTSFERYVGTVYLVDEEGDMTNLVERLQ